MTRLRFNRNRIFARSLSFPPPAAREAAAPAENYSFRECCIQTHRANIRFFAEVLRHPECVHTDESTIEIVGYINEEFRAIEELREASEEEVSSMEDAYIAADCMTATGEAP